jgi:hypothetical protein
MLELQPARLEGLETSRIESERLCLLGQSMEIAKASTTLCRDEKLLVAQSRDR